MTTIANLKELYSLGFIQDFEYQTRLAALGLCDTQLDGDVVEDIHEPAQSDLAPAERDPISSWESEKFEPAAVDEPQTEFTPIATYVAPVSIVEPRIAPIKRLKRKISKI